MMMMDQDEMMMNMGDGSGTMMMMGDCPFAVQVGTCCFHDSIFYIFLALLCLICVGVCALLLQQTARTWRMALVLNRLLRV